MSRLRFPSLARVKRKHAAMGCLGIAVLALCFALFGQSWILDRIAGASRHAPEELETGLSASARAVLDRAYEGIDPPRLLDVHTHVAGLGAAGTGCSVSAEMLTWRHPWKHAQFLVYAHAAGIRDLEHGDEQLVDRLISLARANPRHGRYALLAFDHRYSPGGAVDAARSEMYVPNDYVIALAEREPGLFVPVCSVHPYRRDALAELDRCAARGVKLCKWLPNAMGIDPADERCIPFYERLARDHVALLTHTGDEHAVDTAGAQDLGNPLRLRLALEHGATVILAHCATLGEGIDLDDPARAKVPNFELFLRMMGEERWRGRLFGELSAVALANRDPGTIATLLARVDLHTRLVDGSDYPLPAIRAVWSMRRLVKAGLLTDAEADALEEIYDYNPLVFDFVSKRTLRDPVTGARFEPAIFEGRPELGF